MGLKLSIHPKIKGKPLTDVDVNGKPFYICNGQRVNLGYDWLNVECDWEQAFELITVDGYATSSELLNDHRNEENYVSRQLVMVDIDNGMTIQELFDNEFYNLFGAGFYTTTRHTDTHHRFRILFVLEDPIADRLKMRKVISGLLHVYSAADTSCKDASRIYYGTINCEIKEFRNVILPNYAVDALIEYVDLQTENIVKQYNYQYTNTKYDEVFVDSILSRIKNKTGSLRGDYSVWCTIAWATCHTVGIHNAKALMMRYWPDKTKKEMKSLESWKSHNSPTMGTLIKLSGISSTERQLLELQQNIRRIK